MIAEVLALVDVLSGILSFVAGADDDADRLLAHFDALGLVPLQGPRGWAHMGGVLSDAALQRRVRYRLVVEPRVRDLMTAWPDADTVSGFASRLASGDVGAVLRWRPGPKLVLLRKLAEAMTELGIETVADLRTQLSGTNAPQVRTRLRAIPGVGPKTIDYLGILAGCDDNVAVDSHLQHFAGEARLQKTSYEALSDTVTRAAERRGWTPAAMDGAIWRYMSTRKSA